MKFGKKILTAAIVLSFVGTSALAADSPASSAATPAAAATATPAAASTNTAKLQPVKKRFLLTHSSSVYSEPDKGSTVLAHVRSKSHVHVTGVVGDWLQIHMSSGKSGYIPSSAAE
jgi:uncharacterized protein YgiM (DUF1202 family)